MQHFLRVHRRFDLRCGRSAERTPGDDALGVISPAAVLWRYPINERVVVDGAWVFAAGVTAGIDGALQLAAELRGDEAAQAIQLEMVYAPEPPFNSGTPETAPAAILERARQSVRELTTRREETAQRMATKLGISIPAARAGNDFAGACRFGGNRGRIGAPADSRAPK
jgi:hypothetical protein